MDPTYKDQVKDNSASLLHAFLLWLNFVLTRKILKLLQSTFSTVCLYRVHLFISEICLLGPIYLSFHLSSLSFLEIKDCWYMMQVLLLMASALNLNMPISESAADSVLQGMLKETRARQQCIAEITEMIHVCFWKTCYIFIVFFVLVLFYAFNSWWNLGLSVDWA